MDQKPVSLGKLIGIQIAGGIIAGIIAVTGVVVSWGAVQARLERAVADIELLTDRMYTQREAQLELRPITQQLDRQSRQLESITRRMINMEALYLSEPLDGTEDHSARQ